MGMITIYFDIYALTAALSCLVTGILLYRKTEPRSESVTSIGSFTQSASWLISLVGTVHLLANLSDPGELGRSLAFVILTALYGTAVNVALKIWAARHRPTPGSRRSVRRY